MMGHTTEFTGTTHAIALAPSRSHVFIATLGVSAMFALASCGDSERDDITPPDAPAGLLASATSRVSASIEWVAPSDDDGSAVVAYDLRIGTAPFTDEEFSDQGVALSPGAPAQPGEGHRIDIDVRPGQPLYIGIVAVDAAGNRSALTTTGPIATELSASGALTPASPGDGDNAFGYQVVYGQFGGDATSDVVVAAPFKRVNDVEGAGTVYVYVSDGTGIGNPPDIVLQGTEASAQFGNSVAVLDWNGDGDDDIAVGAPRGDGFHGRVYVFFGGADLASGTTLSDVEADAIIGADPASPWFQVSGIGWTLAAGRYDGDDRDDLAIGAVAADMGVGAIAIVYGGTAADGDVLLSEDAAQMNGAVAHLFFAPDVPQGAYTLFGAGLFNLGPQTSGARDRLGVAFFQQADAFVIGPRDDRPSLAGVYPIEFDIARDLRVTVEPLDPDTYFALSMGTVMDANGDGVRDIALGSYQESGGAGRVSLVSGDALGQRARSDVEFAAIEGASLGQIGSAILNNAMTSSVADIDDDGVEDMAIVGGRGQTGLYIWYGGQTLDGAISADSADYVVPGPSVFTGVEPNIGGVPTVVHWVGDIDGDGLEDLIWADWANNARDGAIEVLR